MRLSRRDGPQRPRTGILGRTAGCVAVVGVLLTGCSANPSFGRDEQTLIIGAEGEIPTLDPHRASGTPVLRVIDALFDPLIREDLGTETAQAPELRPALAESWQASPDARTYTLKLREGVEFADGSPFDAAAVKANFDRIMDENSAFHDPTAAGNMKFLTRWIEKVDVRDPHTVVLGLTEPYAGLPRMLTDRRMSIISPKALRAHRPDDIGLNPVGTGPFTQQSADRGKRITLKRNAAYWGGSPRTPSIIVESVTDPTTLAIAAQTGEVDAILSAGAQQVQQLADGGTMAVQYPEPANQYFIRLNTRIAPTDNAVFRRALNHAVDRHAIATLTGRQVAPSTGPLPRGNEAYRESPGAAADSYDPEEARRLIRESGVPTPVTLRMLAPDSGPGFSQATEIMSLIQQDLKAVGVRLDTQYMEFASLVAEEGNGYNGTTHGSFNGWTTGADAADFLERMFSGELHPPGGVNRGWYRNRDVDALFDRARGEPDPDRRTALYREAADGIAADAPWVFLYQDRLPRLLSRKVDGVVPAASVYIDYTTIRRR
ncbi:ABC transporter substrate-binding protein [Streptomyces anulatus]|uniref:ABC transporter substrate-binding protein n=1 Tax=Streptomyces anulatus TaxID=1892 RepID=UPI002E37AAE9|nr:ABC transporter substrate-binding protein [Streptomyces anulatus]WSU72153.1 ABC transporter substrate-binding protein [Streptomyces anulatus]WTD29473.1 ABC transporter substrate-binding protein [Streptomyces anulatus]